MAAMLKCNVLLACVFIWPNQPCKRPSKGFSIFNSDISLTKQLAICVRYSHRPFGKDIEDNERFLGFDVATSSFLIF